MRVKITALTKSSAAIPFNYNYALHSAIYGLIEKSSGEYSRYLHDKGFINEIVKKRFKLFTFSKLFLRLVNFESQYSLEQNRLSIYCIFFILGLVLFALILSPLIISMGYENLGLSRYIQKLSRIKFERIFYYHVFC